MKPNFYSTLGTTYAKDKQLLKKVASNPNTFVGWVDSYNESNGTVNVQPAIQRENIDENSVANYINRPFLNNVYVIANTLQRSVQKGDKALVFVLDEKSNAFFKAEYDSEKPLQDQTFINNSNSVKTLSNCVAIIINPNYNSGLEIVDNLESYAADKALSANQGRVLNGKIAENTASIETEANQRETADSGLLNRIAESSRLTVFESSTTESKTINVTYTDKVPKSIVFAGKASNGSWVVSTIPFSYANNQGTVGMQNSSSSAYFIFTLTVSTTGTLGKGDCTTTITLTRSSQSGWAANTQYCYLCF